MTEEVRTVLDVYMGHVELFLPKAMATPSSGQYWLLKRTVVLSPMLLLCTLNVMVRSTHALLFQGLKVDFVP